MYNSPQSSHISLHRVAPIHIPSSLQGVAPMHMPSWTGHLGNGESSVDLTICSREVKLGTITIRKEERKTQGKEGLCPQKVQRQNPPTPPLTAFLKWTSVKSPPLGYMCLEERVALRGRKRKPHPLISAPLWFARIVPFYWSRGVTYARCCL